MRVAYLILADGAARHMGRLLRALSSPFVFVHVDRRMPIEPFRAVAAPHVEFAEDRIAVNPRDWSRVIAILGLMRKAFAMRQDWDRLVLLSSTHYPLRDPAYIRSFFSRHASSEFMNIWQIPDSRTPIHHLTTFGSQPRRNPVTAFVALLQSRVRGGILPRDYESALQDWTPFAGDCWWALTGDACRDVLNTVKQDRSRVAFLRDAHNPAEMIFQMVIGNSSRQPWIRGSLSSPASSGGTQRSGEITDEEVARLAARRCSVKDESGRAGEVLFAQGFSDDSERMTALVRETLWRSKAVARGLAQGSAPERWGGGACADAS